MADKTKVREVHAVARNSHGHAVAVLPDSYEEWVHGSAFDSMWYFDSGMDQETAQALVAHVPSDAAAWGSFEAMEDYIEDHGAQQSGLPSLEAVEDDHVSFRIYLREIQALPKGTQATNFHIWAEGRQDYRLVDTFFRHSVGGHLDFPNLIDHAFIAGGFSMWGGEMFKEHEVESVIITEPYTSLEELEEVASHLRNHGFVVWLPEGASWHFEGVNTMIIAAKEVDIPSRVLQSTDVAGYVPLYEFVGFWPLDTEVKTQIYRNRFYGGWNEGGEIGWAAIPPMPGRSR